MITFDVPPGLNPEAFSRLLFEAGLNTSLILEGDVAIFPELEEGDRQRVIDVYGTYQERQAEFDTVVDAMRANEGFLALPAPTTAQAVSQVKALTRQINGLVVILNRRGILE